MKCFFKTTATMVLFVPFFFLWLASCSVLFFIGMAMRGAGCWPLKDTPLYKLDDDLVDLWTWRVQEWLDVWRKW